MTRIEEIERSLNYLYSALEADQNGLRQGRKRKNAEWITLYTDRINQDKALIKQLNAEYKTLTQQPKQ